MRNLVLKVALREERVKMSKDSMNRIRMSQFTAEQELLAEKYGNIQGFFLRAYLLGFC